MNPLRPSRRHARALVVGATVAGGVALLAAPAWAHLDPDPAAIQKGSSGTISFNLEHGCDRSPTVSLELRFPDGFTGLAPVDKAGWTGAVAGQVVTFSGGKLDATTSGTFAVKVTAPATAGDRYVPAVQTCEQGANRWIEIPAAGAAEPEFPAPKIKVTDAAPTAEELRPPADEGTASSDSSGSTTGVVVGIVVAAVVVVGGGVLVVRKRRTPGAPA